MKKVLFLAAALLSAVISLAQTQPNLENGFKPFGSYEGSHLDTVNVMNGNLMFHAPLTPDAPQRGSLKVSNFLYGTFKDWQAVCSVSSTTSLMQCSWQKGGGAISIKGSPSLSVHRTLNKQYTGGSGNTTFAAYGYTVVTGDGASHPLHGVAGTEDINLEPTQFDSADLSGYHVALSVPDSSYPGVFKHVTVTDRSGNQFQGDFFQGLVSSSGCGRIQFSGLSAPGSHPPPFDDAPAGDQYCSQVAYPSLVTDSNGNQISIAGPLNLNPTLDTLGKTPALNLPLNTTTATVGSTTADFSGCSSSHPIYSAYISTYQDPNGVTRQIKLCFAEIQIQTNFGQPSPYTPSTLVSEAVTSTDPSTGLHFLPVVTAVLADGTRYTFDYDLYGDITFIGLPTGGSIGYTWATINFNSCEPSNPTQKSRAVATRTLNDGQGHSFTWRYQWGTPANGSLTNTVTDPLGNDTDHIFSELSPLAGLPAVCRFYETSTVQYQGPKSANQPMQRVDTVFSAASVSLDDPTGSAVPGLANVFATDVTTTLYTNATATKFKKVHKDPDAGLGSALPIFGNTIRQLEYDWAAVGANPALLRETDTTYKWQVDATGNYLHAGLLDLPASVSVIDPNANSPTKPNCPGWDATLHAVTKPCVAETDFGYDEFALQPNSGGIPAGTVGTPAVVRGNQTSVSKWLSTSNSFVTSQTHWYDTGEPYQKIDPLNHITTLTYDPVYAGAYVTQTCSPTTTNPSGSVAHCVSGTYDFTTGVLLSFTNENATQQAVGATHGDQAHTWLYAYDLMFRLTSAQAPPDPDPTNGGVPAITAFSYATAPGTLWSVTRTRPVTNTASDSVTSFYDGLGRITKTQHAMPSGPPATVDTIYDPLGRVASVSNPYYVAGEPTSGVTQTIYDALDRPLLVQKPDGSYSTVAYHDNCTTTQDEAGNARRSCTDALGRLYQVDEPGDGSAGAATDTTNSNTTATASLNLSGAVQMVLIPPPPCPPRQICDQTPDTIYDSGTVSVTVNGHITSAPYGQGDDASSVAGRLTAAINADPAAVVNASASGTLITLTSRTTGRASDYTLQFTTAWDTADFASASFSGLTSGFRLTGGSDDAVFSNAYVTQYHYDVLGNLLCVEQHGNVALGVNGAAPCPAPSTDPNSAPVAPDPNNPWRLRRFAYDSFSRLRWASNPESGVISYAYDADSNLASKTDARGITVNYSPADLPIDELHRVRKKTYSNGDPAVTFTYDSAPNTPNAIGKLVGLTDPAGSASYSYDTLGRMTGESRMIYAVGTNQITKSLSYTYNLGGSLKTLTYPSGAVVTYTPDSAGRILSAIDTTSNINYVTAATYGPDGAITGFKSGQSSTFAGITNTFNYNNRLQPINMSAASPGQTVFSIGYDFHWQNGDNGNVFGITNYKDNTRNQTFTYDPLNRLTSAQNAGTDCTKTVLGGLKEYWGNTYTYDPWGNLTNKTKIQTACAGEGLSVAIDVNNRILTAGYAYDAAGNMTTDGTDLVTATYDAESRIATATKSGVTTAYVYDSDGNRVKKTNGSNDTLYWYMTPGIVAESDLNGNTQSEYVFFNGERVARRDGVNGIGGVFYYFSDHLKTASVITDATGTIKAESDYYPWGGELQFVANDSNHYKFTGKERDTETGLDYFGARYYSNGLGRWISADWSATPIPVPYADFGDPQSLNLYTYVRNIPTTRLDADGHDGWATAKAYGTAVVESARAILHTGYHYGDAIGQAFGDVNRQLNQQFSQSCSCNRGTDNQWREAEGSGNGNSSNSGTANARSAVQEQGRDAQGRFLPKKGGEAPPGSTAEKQGLDSVGAVKNTEKLNGTIRDGTIPETGQHVEVKSGASVSNTEQLQKMGQAAMDATGKPLKVVTTDPNVKVRQPALDNKNLEFEHKPQN